MCIYCYACFTWKWFENESTNVRSATGFPMQWRSPPAALRPARRSWNRRKGRKRGWANSLRTHLMPSACWCCIMMFKENECPSWSIISISADFSSFVIFCGLWMKSCHLKGLQCRPCGAGTWSRAKVRLSWRRWRTGQVMLNLQGNSWVKHVKSKKQT